MANLFHEIFEPAFIYDINESVLVDGNYSFSSLSNLTPRKLKSKKLNIEDIFTENFNKIKDFLEEAKKSSEPLLSTEIKSKLNDTEVVFVFKALKEENQIIVLLNDLSIENILHRKYNALLESSVHIHRKTYAAHNILSRVPNAVPLAISDVFRKCIYSLLELKKIVKINNSSRIHYEGIKKSLTELSNIALNLEYLKEDISHESINIKFGEFFSSFITNKVDNLIDLYSNRAFITYDFEYDFSETSFELDTKKVSDAICALVSNAIKSVIDSNTSNTNVEVKGYILGEAGAEVAYIDVIDYGNSIPSNNLPKIFAPFYSDFEKTGVGLGLPNARKNIQENGGDLKYDKSFLDGNKFTIRFPLNDHIVLSKKEPIFFHTYIFSEHEYYNLILHNFLKLNGIPHSISSSAKEFTQKIKNLKNNTCLIFEYDPKYDKVLIELKNQLPRLSLILLLRIEQYENFLELNEKIRIKDIILHPATYESILKSLTK